MGFYFKIKILEEKREGEIIKYFYNGNDVVGMIYNNEQYTYIKNILGDIISIIDSSGFVVAIYNYDAFGKVEVYNEYSI